MSVSPIELAFSLARTGKFENFTQVKKALRRSFAVDRELVGRQLAADITQVCKKARDAQGGVTELTACSTDTSSEITRPANLVER